MGELLDAGVDLGALCLCYVTIALLLLAASIVALVAKLVPNPSIAGIKPLGFVSDFVTAVQDAIYDALQGVDDAAAKFQSGLGDSLTLLVGIPLLIAVGLYDLITKLAKTWIPAAIHSIVDTTTSTATKAGTDVAALTKTVANDFAKAESYTDTQVAAALNTAKTYAATNIAAAAASLEAEIKSLASTTASGIVTADLAANGAITQAIHDALDKLDLPTAAEVSQDVIDTLKSSGALAAAVAAAVPSAAGLTSADVLSIVQGALAPGTALWNAIKALIPAGSSAAGLTSDDVTGLISTGIADALNPGGAIASAIEAAIPSSLPGGISIPTPSLGDLAATVGTLAATVAGIEAISFISGDACRSNVSQLCGVNSSDLAELLAGIAAIGFAFSLQDIVDTANVIFTDAADLIQAAA